MERTPFFSPAVSICFFRVVYTIGLVARIVLPQFLVGLVLGMGTGLLQEAFF